MRTFTDFEGEIFYLYLVAHSGEFNAYELAKKFMDGKFTSNQIMGKALALELVKHIRKITSKERIDLKKKAAFEAAKSYEEYEREVGYVKKNY